MTTERRIFSPVTASVAAGLMVAAATLGGTMAADDAAEKKTDRFAVVGDSLCEGQTWPNLTAECLAWAQGETGDGRVRYVTIVETDEQARTTTLTRVPADATN